MVPQNTQEGKSRSNSPYTYTVDPSPPIVDKFPFKQGWPADTTRHEMASKGLLPNTILGSDAPASDFPSWRVLKKCQHLKLQSQFSGPSPIASGPAIGGRGPLCTGSSTETSPPGVLGTVMNWERPPNGKILLLRQDPLFLKTTEPNLCPVRPAEPRFSVTIVDQVVAKLPSVLGNKRYQENLFDELCHFRRVFLAIPGLVPFSTSF